MAPLTLSSTASAPNKAMVGMGLPKLKQAINELCRTNFLVFQKVELGMEIAPHHHQWWGRLKTGQDVCEMAPRDHGKSQSLVRAYGIWKAKYDPWCKEVLILGADLPSAIENLDKIKEMMRGRPSLSYLVPTSRSDGVNSRSEVRLTNGKVLKAKGIGSPLRGRHPQLILMDDVLNEKNSDSPENREDMRQHFWEVVYPMKDKGTQTVRSKGFKSQIVIVGTAQARDDLYHILQASNSFLGEKMKAIIDEENQLVLWPQRYSYEDLNRTRESMGSLFFAKEYQNEPLAEETSIFPMSLFEPLKDRSLSYVPNYTGPHHVFLGADFSVPGSSDGDWTVVIAIEWDEENSIFTPLAMWRARPPTFQEQIHQIEVMMNLYNVEVGFLEDNMFQRIYSEHFKNKSGLPLRGNTVTHSGKTNVNTGVLSFRTMFENGKWRFPYKTVRDQILTDQIVSEFNGIMQKKGRIGNESTNDDSVMAMWHALAASRTSSFKVSWT